MHAVINHNPKQQTVIIYHDTAEVQLITLTTKGLFYGNEEEPLNKKCLSLKPKPSASDPSTE